MQIRRSLWITFAVSNGTTVALFLVSLVLARILTPKEIGLFSLSVVVINIAAVFRDLGVYPYLVSKSEVSAETISSVLGLTLTMACLLALAIWLSGDAIVAYFGEPQIIELVHIQLISFVLIPFNAVMSSLLTRSLSAGRSSVSAILATLAYAVVLLSLALLGFGPKAPAWANTALVVTNLVCYWLLMPKGFSLRPRWSGWGQPLRYSGGVLAAGIVNMGNQILPETVVGRSLGAHDVGIYSRGNGLASLFQQAVGPMLNYNALPVIAKTFHENAGALKSLLTRSTELITVLAWPVYIWIACYPTEIITLLYGKSWLSAAGLVPWMCAAAAARTIFTMIAPALQAVGEPYSAAFAAVPCLILRVLVLGVIGTSDLQTFVVALCLVDVASLAAYAVMSKLKLGLGVMALFTGQWRSGVVAGSCLAMALLLKLPLAWLSIAAIPAVMVSALCVFVVWAISLYASRHPFAEELNKGLRKLRPKAGAAAMQGQ